MRVSPALNKLASALISGDRSPDNMVDRLSRILARRWKFLTPLVREYLRVTENKPRPRRREAVLFLLGNPGFRRAWKKRLRKVPVDGWIEGAPLMQPVPAAAGWSLPAIRTAGDLSEWLRLTPSELDWFADLKGLANKLGQPRLEHYHYRLFVKRSGGIRLIEAPKSRLKELQRAILAGILERIPPHPFAHGFVRRRSIRSFTAPHVGQRAVLRMDLRDFFPSLPAARVQSFFRVAGYPETVADLLGGICTNSVPVRVWSNAPIGVSSAIIPHARTLYARRHLPQGAPTSPALANICAYRLDCRLSGLARSAGARYTRYADDLAFSGDRDFERSAERFCAHAAAIASEEGFAVHYRKTRIMRQGVRQHLAGLVVNRRANITRRDFDLLKATLTNCVRHGPSGENRAGHPYFRAHLEGRVAFIESINPAKGAKLRALFSRIIW